MNKRPRKLLYVLTISMVIAVLGIGCLFAYNYLGNEHARKAATSFCDSLVVGSEISDAIERAEKKGVGFLRDRIYTFHFPGAFFDTAVCEVEVGDDKTVKSRSVNFYRD